MKTGVYAGSFDTITKGHQDIIERALKIVDKLIVVVMNNPKKNYWFNLDERKNLISKIFEGDKSIKVDEHAGLLVDFMAKNSCGILIKGLRDVKDFSEEMTYSFANKKLSNGEVDTIFIPTSEKYTYVSSTFVKELAFYSQSLAGYVDDKVIVDILNRAKEYRDRG